MYIHTLFTSYIESSPLVLQLHAYYRIWLKYYVPLVLSYSIELIYLGIKTTQCLVRLRVQGRTRYREEEGGHDDGRCCLSPFLARLFVEMASPYRGRLPSAGLLSDRLRRPHWDTAQSSYSALRGNGWPWISSKRLGQYNQPAGVKWAVA
jgi:hypothetical protein